MNNDNLSKELPFKNKSIYIKALENEPIFLVQTLDDNKQFIYNAETKKTTQLNTISIKKLLPMNDTSSDFLKDSVFKAEYIQKFKCSNGCGCEKAYVILNKKNLHAYGIERAGHRGYYWLMTPKKASKYLPNKSEITENDCLRETINHTYLPLLVKEQEKANKRAR